MTYDSLSRLWHERVQEESVWCTNFQSWQKSWYWIAIWGRTGGMWLFVRFFLECWEYTWHCFFFRLTSYYISHYDEKLLQNMAWEVNKLKCFLLFGVGKYHSQSIDLNALLTSFVIPFFQAIIQKHVKITIIL